MSLTHPVLKMVKFPDPILGGYSYRLINLETLDRVPFFTDFLMEKKRSGSAVKSVDSYAYDLYSFLSYLTVASEIVPSIANTTLSPLTLTIGAYPEFLVVGRRSSSKLIRQTAVKLGWKPVASPSQKRMLSTLNEFIKTSAAYQRVQNELIELGLLNTLSAPNIFAEELLSTRKLSARERRAMLHRSFLAGCIYGGAKIISSKFFKFKIASKAKGADSNKGFPLNAAIKTLNNATTARDQAMWALLMGTGLRISEVLTLLMIDIDPLKERVYVHDPNQRIHLYPIKSGAKAELPFKGRETSETFFIEPFRTIFFDALKQYLDYERPPTSHSVLFVSMARNISGQPLYYASNANTYNKIFKKAAAKAGVTEYAIHSLRHMYGIFAINFIPTGYGVGLPLKTVQLMMGHASIKSTEVYACIDKDKARATLENFNILVKNEGLELDDAKSVDIRVKQVSVVSNKFSSK